MINNLENLLRSNQLQNSIGNKNIDTIMNSVRGDPNLLKALSGARNQQEVQSILGNWSKGITGLKGAPARSLQARMGTEGAAYLSNGLRDQTRLGRIGGALSRANSSRLMQSPAGKAMKGLGGTALAAWALLPLLQGKGAFGIRALGGKSREDEMYDRQMQMYERAIRMAQLGQMAQSMGATGFNNAMSPIYGASSFANPYFNYTPGARQVR